MRFRTRRHRHMVLFECQWVVAQVMKTCRPEQFARVSDFRSWVSRLTWLRGAKGKVALAAAIGWDFSELIAARSGTSTRACRRGPAGLRGCSAQPKQQGRHANNAEAPPSLGAAPADLLTLISFIAAHTAIGECRRSHSNSRTIEMDAVSAASRFARSLATSANKPKIFAQRALTSRARGCASGRAAAPPESRRSALFARSSRALTATKGPLNHLRRLPPRSRLDWLRRPDADVGHR